VIQQSAVALTSGAVKALLRDHRTREDVLEAVLALHESGPAGHPIGEAAAAHDLTNVFRWADALARLLTNGDGLVLLACYRQAERLLREAEQQGMKALNEKPQRSLYRLKEERELAVALMLARTELATALTEGEFEAAMHTIATLRPFIRAFFDKVDFDSAMMDLRENRLRLVHDLFVTLRAIGDLSKIEEQAEIA
jgi:glycyl-tRNA synthetase beta chain